MKEINSKVIVVIAIVAIIIFVTIGLYIFKTNENSSSIIYGENIIEENSLEDEDDQTNTDKITVYVVGEVNYSGVVVLKQGDRVVDAIVAAGGETENADLSKLNLAYILSDGEKIVIPNKNENDNQNTSSGYISSGIGGESTVNNNNIININTASSEELTKIPGVGEAIANKIIAYRGENGKFKTIEELKNVPGIGDSKFNGMKDVITVK